MEFPICFIEGWLVKIVLGLNRIFKFDRFFSPVILIYGTTTLPCLVICETSFVQGI